LRVTREPIHIYVIEDGNKVRGVPVNLFVSTSYADGTPAQCEVEISQDLSADAGGVRISRSRHMRTVKTNRYGVARAAALVIADSEKTTAVRRYWDASIDFAARDREGRRGHASESISYYSSDLIRVETNKALYKTGEPVEVSSDRDRQAIESLYRCRATLEGSSLTRISLVNGPTADAARKSL
jgi:hypothetical protein